MKKIFKNEMTVAILLGALLISISIVSYGLINKNSNKGDTLTNLMTVDKIFQGKNFKENEYILGNNKNKITIAIYSDFECPFCKMLQEETIQVLQKKYSNGKDYRDAKIGIIYRHFAQSYHDKAPNEINASLCARELYGQNTYINFINRIYSITPTNNGLDQNLLPEIANFAVTEAKQNKQEYKKEFEMEEFMNCLNAKIYDAEFKESTQDAIDIGLDGTPYTLILYKNGNDNIIMNKISGAKDSGYFEKIINKLLQVK